MLRTRLGEQRAGRLARVLAGPGDAAGDQARDDRRGEGRAAPLGHAFEVAMRASVRRLAVVVGPCRVGIDQVLAGGVHVHPWAIVAEVGPGPAVRGDRAYP